MAKQKYKRLEAPWELDWKESSNVSILPSLGYFSPSFNGRRSQRGEPRMFKCLCGGNANYNVTVEHFL